MKYRCENLVVDPPSPAPPASNPPPLNPLGQNPPRDVSAPPEDSAGFLARSLGDELPHPVVNPLLGDFESTEVVETSYEKSQGPSVEPQVTPRSRTSRFIEDDFEPEAAENLRDQQITQLSRRQCIDKNEGTGNPAMWECDAWLPTLAQIQVHVEENGIITQAERLAVYYTGFDAIQELDTGILIRWIEAWLKAYIQGTLKKTYSRDLWYWYWHVVSELPDSW